MVPVVPVAYIWPNCSFKANASDAALRVPPRLFCEFNNALQRMPAHVGSRHIRASVRNSCIASEE